MPGLVTESEAFSTPIFIASLVVYPDAIPYEKAPTKASPAPVVSGYTTKEAIKIGVEKASDSVTRPGTQSSYSI